MNIITISEKWKGYVSQPTLCILKCEWEKLFKLKHTVHPFQKGVSQQTETTGGKLLYLNFPAKVLTEKVASREQSTHWADLVSSIGWRLTVSTLLRVNLAITKSSLPDHTIILPRRHCGQSGGAGAANSGLTIYSASHIKSLRSDPIQHVLIFISRPTPTFSNAPNGQKMWATKHSTIFPGKVSWCRW